MHFDRDGAALYPGAALSILGEVEAALDAAPQDRPGIRLHGDPRLAAVVDAGLLARIAQALRPQARAVRAILFDKTPENNWALGWHQDRTIAVAARRDAAGYGPWSMKAGVQHVEPPFALIERMVTLRLHLDDVGTDGAPLLIAPGSHRLGRIAVGSIEDVVRRCGSRACLAARGDVWAYATPILHASARSESARRRRVLQVDYSADRLAPGLDWLGV